MRRGSTIVVTAAAAIVVWCAGAASAGTTWVIQATPNPAGSTDSSLSSVSCTSPTSCTAVGSYFNNSSAELTLAEHWDGSTWAIQATPNPASASESSLLGVSCASPTSCTAVGSSSVSFGPESTLAEHWDGSTWAIQATPNPAGANVSVLTSVSCASLTSCTAVGWWCPGPNCRRPNQPLAEHWNGSTWVRQAIPIPTGSTGTNLYGVSCQPANSCTAAGWYSNSSGVPLTLAEHWNGSTWAIQATPNPVGSPDSRLNGISCRSATSCTATGQYSNGSGGALTLAEHWDGSTWAIQATPNPAGALGSSLQGVSCASLTSCTATGWTETPLAHFRPLALYWNGSTWAIQTTPSPLRAAKNLSLGGVSCTAAASCTAVGYYLTSSAQVTLAEAK